MQIPFEKVYSNMGAFVLGNNMVVREWELLGSIFLGEDKELQPQCSKIWGTYLLT